MIGRLINRVEEGAIAFLLLFMTAMTFLQVVLRYVFNSGFVWALEATTYAFIWMVLLVSWGVVSSLFQRWPLGAMEKPATSVLKLLACTGAAPGCVVGAVALTHLLPTTPIPGLTDVFVRAAKTNYTGPVWAMRDGDVISLPASGGIQRSRHIRF